MGLEADCVKIVEETIKELGGLDVIISNAVSHPSLPLLPGLIPSSSWPGMEKKETVC
jgi:NAD(P)-dependent dehydrogenase (short-subunit alcohol dehydrogenase family)